MFAFCIVACGGAADSGEPLEPDYGGGFELAGAPAHELAGAVAPEPTPAGSGGAGAPAPELAGAGGSSGAGAGGAGAGGSSAAGVGGGGSGGSSGAGSGGAGAGGAGAGGVGGAAGHAGAAGGAAGAGSTLPAREGFCALSAGQMFAGSVVGCDQWTAANMPGWMVQWQYVAGYMLVGYASCGAPASPKDYPCLKGAPCKLINTTTSAVAKGTCQ
jgi:hypothetical protein